MTKRITSPCTLSLFLGITAMFFMPATATAGSKSDTEVTTAIIDTFIEVWNTKAYGKLDPIIAPNFKRIAPGGTSNASGLAEFKAVLKKFHTAYPDFAIKADRTAYYPGGATVEWSVTGTNTGPGDHPPTGKKIKLAGITTLNVKDGKVTREYVAFDTLHWMEQLGFTLQAP